MEADCYFCWDECTQECVGCGEWVCTSCWGDVDEDYPHEVEAHERGYKD